MTTTIENRTDVYSRPNARFGEDGTLEIRASAVGNCRRALWYEANEYPVTNPRSEGVPDRPGDGQRPGAGGAAGHAARRLGHHPH